MCCTATLRFPHLLLTANHLQSTVIFSFRDAMEMTILHAFQGWRRDIQSHPSPEKRDCPTEGAVRIWAEAQ
ncbi:hypothetical protein BC827DRAFT_1241563 [Russula dissimulans]|nr:hypothetical protein BC827DRAFT_1241563 [Russula dissimulans]